MIEHKKIPVTCSFEKQVAGISLRERLIRENIIKTLIAAMITAIITAIGMENNTLVRCNRMSFRDARFVQKNVSNRYARRGEISAPS